jgi:hypothetical protein
MVVGRRSVRHTRSLRGGRKKSTRSLRGGRKKTRSLRCGRKKTRSLRGRNKSTRRSKRSKRSNVKSKRLGTAPAALSQTNLAGEAASPNNNHFISDTRTIDQLSPEERILELKWILKHALEASRALRNNPKFKERHKVYMSWPLDEDEIAILKL